MGWEAGWGKGGEGMMWDVGCRSIRLRVLSDQRRESDESWVSFFVPLVKEVVLVRSTLILNTRWC